MIDLQLDAEDWDSYLKALRRKDHMIRIRVSILNNWEEPLDGIEVAQNQLIDGSVNVDCGHDSIVTRSLELSLLDPRGQLRFEPDNPASGVLYADRFIRCWYGVFVDEMNDWVDVPVFYGPVTNFTRVGNEVTIQAMGKESLMRDPHFATLGYNIDKGTKVDDAIRKVANHAGEHRYDMPQMNDKLAKSRAVTAQTEPWTVIVGGEDSQGGRSPGLIEVPKKRYSIFYDGRGRLCIRRIRRRPLQTLKLGRDFTADPNIAFDDEEFRNTADVTGSRPKGKKPAHARRHLPRSHPLSPYRLQRTDGDGVDRPRFMTAFFEAESLKSDEECVERADEELKDLDESGMTVEVECLPMPHFEEFDRIRIVTDDYEVPIRLLTFTIPLSSASMTIGYNRHVDDLKRRKKGSRRYRR